MKQSGLEKVTKKLRKFDQSCEHGALAASREVGKGLGKNSHPHALRLCPVLDMNSHLQLST